MFLSGGAALPPFSVAYIKGWRRSLACLICCEDVRALGISFEDLTTNFKDPNLVQSESTVVTVVRVSVMGFQTLNQVIIAGL